MAQIGRVAGAQGARHLAMHAANVTRSDEQAIAALERRQLDLAEQLVNLLGTMRGAAMKVGQSLSIVDFGLIPASHREDFQRKLASLQDRAPKVPWRHMAAQIERGIGGRLDDVFAEFDREPVAAASIGQVYRARLGDGRDVAVKVQYPGIASAVRSDIKNLRMFARHYRGHPFIRVPDVRTELCSETVLVTDWLEGRPLKAAADLDQPARDRVAEILFRFYMGGPHELLGSAAIRIPGTLCCSTTARSGSSTSGC
jgi:predicted unusual protein kinase regulating ubiquinone biosynthesis (AarF/ABC1/UbiB family)